MTSEAAEARPFFVNGEWTYRPASISTPFDGVKASGLGREQGIEGMRAYMAQKSIYLGLSERPIAWP
jgi:betaine-aldehyde dehydrogenase